MFFILNVYWNFQYTWSSSSMEWVCFCRSPFGRGRKRSRSCCCTSFSPWMVLAYILLYRFWASYYIRPCRWLRWLWIPLDPPSKVWLEVLSVDKNMEMNLTGIVFLNRRTFHFTILCGFCCLFFMRNLAKKIINKYIRSWLFLVSNLCRNEKIT